MISAQGIYDIPLADYIADPASTISCSASIGWAMLTRSPAHARAMHPRLTSHKERKNSKVMDFGTVAHRLLLGKGGEIEVIEADSYRKKDAQEARDAAYAAGRTPILEHDYRRAAEMADAATAQLVAHDIGDIFDGPGDAEQTFIWREDNGVWCRGCADWLVRGSKRTIIYDIKTTQNAHPDVWVRRVTQLGHAFKAAWYCRGVSQILGDVRFRFIAQETTAPYALAVYELTDEDMIQAEQDVSAAISWWGRCLESGVWPAYPPKVMQLPLPGGYRAAREKAQASGELSEEAIEQAIQWSKAS